MATKERIIDTALTLFATQGYKGTTVKNIADAVGIKDSSLYKHISGKQEILDIIQKRMEEGLNRGSEISVPHSAQEWQALAASWLERLYADPDYQRFWKLCQAERFHSERWDNIFRRVYIRLPLEYLEAVIETAMTKKELVRGNVPEMATSFFAPVAFVMYACGTQEQMKKQALQWLQPQIDSWLRQYRKEPQPLSFALTDD